MSPQVSVERQREGSATSPPERRRWVARLRAAWSWWPVGLSLVLGLVLLGHTRAVLTLDPAVETLVRIVFVTSVAGAVLATFLRFLGWWFFTRRQH